MAPLLMLLALPQDTPAFRVSGDAAGRLVYTAPRIEADALVAFEAAVTADARRRCGTEVLTFGAFSYDQQVDRDGTVRPIVGYRREIGCGPESLGEVAPVAADWTPRPEDEAAARDVAARLFAAYDRGDAAAVVALTERNDDPAGAARRVANWRRQAGIGHRVVERVTWYVNPAAAPKPGIYVALDWRADYPALAIGCGYIVLYRTRDRFRVMREETNLLTRAAAPAPDKVAHGRALLPCG